jgi:SagB-type dehydrogenase family enzyme
MGVGDSFQKKTKHSRGELGASPLDWLNRPGAHKNYPTKRSIELPRELPTKTLPLIEALRKRRSTRSFSHRPMPMKELSFLLWASTGIQRGERGRESRTVPSAGALYPIETYVIANNVKDLEKGLYHYSVGDHALEELRLADLGEEAARAALEQEMCAEAPVVFVWTAVFQRSKWKYGQRAYRYVYLDAGHIAQNLALSATSIGMGTCQIGAFFDEEVNRILGVDGTEESAIYLAVVGHPK